MFVEIFVGKDLVIDSKQEPKMMAGSDGDAQKNDSKIVMEETKAIVDEDGVDAKAPMGIETKCWSK